MKTEQLKDHELIALGYMLTQQLDHATDAWKLAVTCLPIGSKTFKAICQAGQKTQDAYLLIDNIAALQLSSEDYNRIFNRKSACAFN
jgi:hypothetical protein